LKPPAPFTCVSSQLEDLEALLPTLGLPPKDQALKNRLVEEGFGDWTRKDFRSFTLALEQFGRKDRDAVFRQVRSLAAFPPRWREAVESLLVHAGFMWFLWFLWFLRFQVAHETGKGEADVERYLDAFTRCGASQLVDYAKVMEKVERGEKKIARQTEIADALSAKVGQRLNIEQHDR
jgi:SWI/SNF-related matrix-associated actin-dependent regulator of chromatin subfamily A member 5